MLAAGVLAAAAELLEPAEREEDSDPLPSLLELFEPDSLPAELSGEELEDDEEDEPRESVR